MEWKTVNIADHPVVDSDGVPTEMGLAVWYVYRCELFDKSFGTGVISHVARRSMSVHGEETRKIITFIAYQIRRDICETTDFIRMLNSNNGREIDLEELKPLYDLVQSWIERQN